MDLLSHRGSTSTSDTQHPILPSGYMSLEQWSSTSFLSTCEIQTTSSLVSSTVSTISPFFHPATNENEDPVSVLQLPGTSTAFEDQDQETPPPPCGHAYEVEQRKPSDDLLEEKSVNLIFPKHLCEREPGMTYDRGGQSFCLKGHIGLDLDEQAGQVVGETNPPK